MPHPCLAVLPLIGPTPTPPPVLLGPLGASLPFWPPQPPSLLPVREALNLLEFSKCSKVAPYGLMSTLALEPDFLGLKLRTTT